PLAALPPARPAESAASSSSSSDPIAELLAGEPHGDTRLTLAAQTALAKLGYPVKPDGKEGSATEQALREFERAHGLPSATEITERLVKQLTAAARAGGH
ncbi:MAG: peptidoglycan-binding domain-containing protein, partial [Roseiarcus sp.]